MAIYLIQGFSFHKRLQGTERFTQVGGSVPTIAHEAVTRLMFSGVIFGERRSTTNLSGYLQDRFGNSRLMYVNMNWIRGTLNSIDFVKKYDHRSDVIHYEMTFNGYFLAGKYKGGAVGEGFVNCYITNASGSLFFPPPLEV